jgi:hypothetical protein
MITSLSTVFSAASSDPRTAEFGGVYAYLPDAVWTQAGEGKVLAARSWRTLLNDPHLQALAFCLQSQILGDGLWFRSEYASDKPQDDAVRAFRKRINRLVGDSNAGRRLDAGAMLTQPDLDAQMLLAGFFGGNGWAIRTWKPTRPGISTGTCWRVIDADRVETPPALKSRGDVVNGVRYVDRTAVSIFVRSWDPAQSAQRWSGFRAAGATYQEYPLIAPDGLAGVLHYAPLRWRADGDLGVPALAAGLVLAHQLAELFKAHVSGKRIQASHPIVLEVANPKKAAEEYAAAVEAGEADADAQVLFVPKGSGAVFTNAQYNGADFEAVANVYLRAISASVGYSWQFVMCQLTDANMASAQAALDQAERTSTYHQRQWIEQVQTGRDACTVREAWVRGQLGPVAWGPELYAATWQRPRRADANRQRTRQAAMLSLQLGISPSTICDEMGYDYAVECERTAEDRATADRAGVRFPQDNAVTTPSGAGGEPTPARTESGSDDPAPEDQEQPIPTALRQAVASARPAAAAPSQGPMSLQVHLHQEGTHIQVAVPEMQAPINHVHVPAQAAPVVHNHVAAAEPPAAQTIVVQSAAPVINNQVVVPARTVIAEPLGDGRVKMTPQ